MGVRLTSSGSTDSTEKFLRKMLDKSIYASLSKYGQAGVNALAAATPVDSGETANSWYYEIVQDATSWSIIWGNSHVESGRPIAVLLEHGHGTRNGGYVQGRHYINGALQPIFDQIASEAWKAVTSA